MLEVEGAGEAECRRILRHEAGHAIDDAYALSRRKRYRDLFGDPEAPYPNSYRPRPESRDYVINLANWYAQAHPVEDFAETFAIWLNPHIDWRRDYMDWPALEKLEFVDGLMREIADKPPAAANTCEVEPLRKVRDARRALRGEANTLCMGLACELRPGLAPHLLRRPQGRRRAPRHTLPAPRPTAIAGAHCDRNRSACLCRRSAPEADDRPSQKLGLRVIEPPNLTIEKLLVMLTMQTAGVVHTGYPKVAL